VPVVVGKSYATRMLGLIKLFLLAAAVVVAIGTLGVVRGIIRPRRKTLAVALGRGDPGDPADLGLTATERTVTFGDANTSPAWLIDGESADGPTVVVLHGHSDSRYGALTWAPLLVPHARRVVVFDLPGHGESSAKRSRAGAGDAPDVLRVIDQLPDPEPVVLFGYSMGAGIAIATAALDARRPESDRRVMGVIADGVYRHWNEPIRRLLRCRRYPVQPFLFLAGLVFRAMGLRLSEFDRVRHASTVRCPMLLLHGERDGLCPIEDARQVEAAAPHATLVTFPQGSHLELARVDADRYRRALADFFTSLARADFRSPRLAATMHA